MIPDPDVLALRPELHQHVEAGERRRAGAGGDDLDVLDALAGDLQRVDAPPPDDDGVPC